MSIATITVLPPVGKEKVVICLESGHSALVEKKGGKGTDISSRFQQKAALMGCIIKNMVEIKQEDKPNKDQVITSIVEAIKKLQPDEYNSAGYPNLDAVTKHAGFKVSSAQLNKAWAAFQEEATQ
ncbi:hypothetical protein [Entomomonas asaccharolytica]|uniref:Uncharacterized protein n=1 Tax=Entomomonas asaccharolytica TaxID=2785331 RepID=A0A974RWF2_9GAMM|nr:hypothetical protein [Entomomonas asaccharolytica]QQP85072.1 hypothetical protein JHT90_11845 [Entomomonas asaccharolytica]